MGFIVVLLYKFTPITISLSTEKDMSECRMSYFIHYADRRDGSKQRLWISKNCSDNFCIKSRVCIAAIMSLKLTLCVVEVGRRKYQRVHRRCLLLVYFIALFHQWHGLTVPVG